MKYVEEGHEVLAVDSVITNSQTAVFSKHHTFVRHISVQAPTFIAVGEVGTVSFSWRRWDDGEVEPQPIHVMINGEEKTIDGDEVLEFSSDEPGIYEISTVNPMVQNATVRIEVV